MEKHPLFIESLSHTNCHTISGTMAFECKVDLEVNDYKALD